MRNKESVREFEPSASLYAARCERSQGVKVRNNERKRERKGALSAGALQLARALEIDARLPARA